MLKISSLASLLQKVISKPKKKVRKDAKRLQKRN